MEVPLPIGGPRLEKRCSRGNLRAGKIRIRLILPSVCVWELHPATVSSSYFWVVGLSGQVWQKHSPQRPPLVSWATCWPCSAEQGGLARPGQASRRTLATMWQAVGPKGRGCGRSLARKGQGRRRHSSRERGDSRLLSARWGEDSQERGDISLHCRHSRARPRSA